MNKSHISWRIFLFFIFSIIIFGCAGKNVASAQTATTTKTGAPTKSYERIFYFTDSKTARKSFWAHPSQIDIFAPVAYTINRDGVLSGSIDPALINFAKQNHIKIMPLAANANFSSSTIAQFLDNPNLQESVIAKMTVEAKTYGYNGWQIDFEQIDSSYRQAFSNFISRFGIAMKNNGLISSVAVIAQIGENPNAYPNNLWQNLIGVYDYSELGKDVDFLSIMSYDDPYSRGPIAGYDWLGKVIAYASSTVPKEKTSLGIGFYYWQWNGNTGKRVGIGGNTGIQNAFNKHYVSQTYSKLEQAPYLNYRTKGVDYVIWFENWQSVQNKISLVKQNGLRGFSAWALGLEVPSVWSVIRKNK
jgi:spore germination protein YaaH